MTREELVALEQFWVEEVTKRRRLGGYSTDAESLLSLSESMLKMVRHALSQLPKEKK